MQQKRTPGIFSHHISSQTGFSIRDARVWHIIVFWWKWFSAGRLHPYPSYDFPCANEPTMKDIMGLHKSNEKLQNMILTELSYGNILIEESWLNK